MAGLCLRESQRRDSPGPRTYRGLAGAAQAGRFDGPSNVALNPAPRTIASLDQWWVNFPESHSQKSVFTDAAAHRCVYRHDAEGSNVLPKRLTGSAMTTFPSPERLSRPRLHGLLTAGTRICSIVAPAGFGKSTLCAEVARRHEGPKALVSAGSHLAIGTIREEIRRQLSPRPSDVEALIVVDDAHLLDGTPALADLLAIVAGLESTTRLLLAGRTAPPVDLQPSRLDGSLCEIGADDLRFRSWEVEELFQRVYRLHLPPSELMALAAATEGWAAALQLYRHATRRSSESARIGQIKQLRQSRLETVRLYLSANVLAGLPDVLRSFALGSSVLGRMEPAVCNRFLGRIDSQRCLDRLVELQLFTTRSDDGTYRYHDVFRSFLEGELAASTDAETLSELYGRAGRMLEERDATSDAIRAYAVAGNEPEAARLVATLHALPDRPWMDAIPDGLLSDPRLRLARARMLMRAGRPATAMAELSVLLSDPQASEVHDPAVREVDRLRRWEEPQPRPIEPTEWLSIARSATQTCLAFRPIDVGGNSALGSLVVGIAALCEGDVDLATFHFDGLDHEALSAIESIVGSALGAIAWWIADGVDPCEELVQLRDAADRHHLGWLTRLLRSLLIAFPQPGDAAPQEMLSRLDEESRRAADRWSPAVARLSLLLVEASTQGLGSLANDWATCSVLFRELGADALAVWAIASRYLCDDRCSGDTSSAEGRVLAAQRSSELAWATLQPGRLAALLRATDGHVTSVFSTDDPDAHRLTLFLGAREAMFQHDDAPTKPLGTRSPSRIGVRLFGSFEVVVDGVPVGLDGLRPRARSILRLLALHAGSPVHRETILETMWPDADPVAAGKRLHVSISAIRNQLGSIGSIVSRDAEAYQFGGVGWNVTTDLRAFDTAVTAMRNATNAADRSAADGDAQAVVSLYSGDLLLEEGPSSWVVFERSDRMRAYLDGLHHLAASASRSCDWRAAEALCRQGLRADRYDDTFWATLLRALDEGGRSVDLERARAEHRSVLAELGLVG